MQYFMFKNYFKIGWRALIKNKLFSFINIFGLSTGLVCCILISLYIVNELSYDDYQKNADNIYQLGTTFIQQGQEHSNTHTPAFMAQAMQQEFPEIQQSTRLMSLFGEDKTLLQCSKEGSVKSFYETKGFLADSTFFRMFTYNFIEGNSINALNNPRSIVLSKDIADKLFGNEPALHKIVHISSSTNGDNDYMVTGVFVPIDKPSHIDGHFFMSINDGKIEGIINHYGTNLAINNIFVTYLQLKPQSDAKKLQAKFPAFVDKYGGKDLKEVGFYKKQFLVNVKDIHLRSGMTENVTSPGSLPYIYILASIALFVLLIACINFMNLSTANSSKRSKEVGIRKVLGAKRKLLAYQFLGESVFMSVLAFIFAFGISTLLLPLFNWVAEKNLSLSFTDNGWIIATLFFLSIITGLIAGSYPALYLSSFEPITILKGKLANSLASVSLRKGLVVFQFVISVTLIIASVVIMNQMHFLRSADLGFDKDRQLLIPLRSENAKNIYIPLKNEISKLPEIESVGASSYNPGIFNASNFLLYKEGQSINDARVTQMNTVDVDYLQTLHIQPVAGRLFSKDFPSDTGNYLILNETAIYQIGFTSPQQAIGKKIYLNAGGQSSSLNVIGVVKDFHFQDLHLPIAPYAFGLSNIPRYNYMIVHAKPGDISKLLKPVQLAWHVLNAGEPFEYSFLDKDFQKNYIAENHETSVVNYFTIIAIVVSCLGLFGLATFSAEQRIKEIGVRKVLGASVSSIVILFSKDFLKLVIIAVVIASPLAWLIMNKWLQNFAYRIHISWMIFAITTLISLFIAFITISFQSIKAAIANPVKSLRTE
jgi:putative ABC transport system permease protein